MLTSTRNGESTGAWGTGQRSRWNNEMPIDCPTGARRRGADKIRDLV